MKLGKKSKPLLVPPFPFNLGTLNCYLFIRYLDCWVYVDTYKMSQAVREARNWRQWQDQGWKLKPSQVQQVILFENGELEKRMRDINASYEFGQGADEHLSKEKAMTLEVFTMQDLNSYFAT